MLDISSIYTSETKLLILTKDANIVVGSTPCHFFKNKKFFTLDKVTLNVVYYFQIYYSQWTGDIYTEC